MRCTYILFLLFLVKFELKASTNNRWNGYIFHSIKPLKLGKQLEVKYLG